MDDVHGRAVNETSLRHAISLLHTQDTKTSRTGGRAAHAQSVALTRNSSAHGVCVYVSRRIIHTLRLRCEGEGLGATAGANGRRFTVRRELQCTDVA